MIVTGPAAASRTAERADLRAPPLDEDARVEVCIVGAGLAGLTAAYLLCLQQRSVMVLEDGAIGGTGTAAEVAHLGSVPEQPYHVLERLHGTAGARMAAQGFAAAIDTMCAAIRRERIACELERLDGYRFVPEARSLAELEREVEAARRAGAGGVEALECAPFEGAEPVACVRYPGQAQLHPARYVAGLARAIARAGGRIHGGVNPVAPHPGHPSRLVTGSGRRVEADVVIMPGAARLPSPPAHAVGLRVPRGAVSRALYWEATRAMRCARLVQGTRDAEMLLVAGRGDPDALADWAHRRFPRAGEVVQRHTAEPVRTADLFAFVAHKPCDSRSAYVSTSSWGTAMTRATVAGMAIRDFVEGARAPWGELSMPSACYDGRFEPASAR